MWTRHEACPRCVKNGRDRHGDNLGVHIDGHKWCFSCGLYIPGTGVISLEQARILLDQQEKRGDTRGTLVQLPPDYTSIIPEQALEWLKQYDISPDEIHHYKMGWSPMYQRLIFPIFDDRGNVLMWQGRFFKVPLGEEHRSKYFTQGKVETVLALFGDDEASQGAVVVVEDFISAIKVARVGSSMCLWGSEFSVLKMSRLARLFSKVIIWLDPDKFSHAMKCQAKARPYFDHVSVVSTNKDPKAYSTQEIKQLCPLTPPPPPKPNT